MSTNAGNAETALRDWSLRPMGAPPPSALHAGVKRRPSSCPPFPADPAAPGIAWGAACPQAAHPPEDFPEPKST